MSDRKDQQKVERETGTESAGQSGGGAYPNPHTGKTDKSGKSNGFLGHGGQFEMEYHGTGQLGQQKTGENPNAPARNAGNTKD
jgi:hypothetical protein